jgi:UDP-3-O-[3-hydroxymyristoyl] glucosamine N-acyltransferase
MHTLAELAEILKAEVVGSPEALVQRAQAFETAQTGDLTFAVSEAYRARLNDSLATAVIIAPPVIETRTNLLVVKNPKLAFAKAIQALHHNPYVPNGISSDFVKGEDCQLGSDLSIHPRVTLGQGVVLGDRVTLHSGVVIGDRSRIGDDSIIHANVSIYADCELGNRSIVHSGTVIGADGFGFVPDEAGRQVKLLQLGRVIIEDDVEIGANCTIDRGNFADTILRRGVKLDNLVQVGHATEIGENTVVAALTGFSGGTRVGRGCVIAGQVGTQQHITIGDNCLIVGQTGVTKNIPAGSMIGGMSQDLRGWRRSQVLYSQLPDIHSRLKEVEKAIKGLIQKQGGD